MGKNGRGIEMKKRYVMIAAFTAAMVLAGSVAYAADRRKKNRQAVDDEHNLSEEILRVELLSAGEEGGKRSPLSEPVGEGDRDAVQADLEREYASLQTK